MKKELTNTSKGRYSESLKTYIHGFRTRQICDFFVYPNGWLRAENNQYQPELLYVAFSEATHLAQFVWSILKRTYKMTNTIISKISEIRSILDDVYANTSSQPLALECSAVRRVLATLAVDILDEDAVNNISAAE